MGGLEGFAELSRFLDSIGVEFDTIDTDAPMGIGESNLIILGGTDVNAVSRRVGLHFRLRYRFAPILMNSETGVTYPPLTWSDGSEGIVFDYGVIVRAQSPWHKDRALVAIWGNYGFGTWGAVRAMTQRRTLEAISRVDSKDIECLIRVEARGGKEILGTEILSVEALDSADVTSGVTLNLRDGRFETDPTLTPGLSIYSEESLIRNIQKTDRSPQSEGHRY